MPLIEIEPTFAAAPDANKSSIPPRRLFLEMAGLATASLALSRRLHALVGKDGIPFEVSASLYPWEIHDEGIGNILDNLQSMAKVNSVYLLGIMHYEKRPFTSPFFPHNPVRKTWQAEDSRCYWHPDPKYYGRIKPLPSDFSWLRETDWLNVLIQAARKRGLRTGVELSHTLVPLEFMLNEFADCAQQDIHHVSHPVYGRTYPLCPNNPDSQKYALGLYSDLTANYDVDYIQTCQLPMMPGGADVGGCFCPSCVKAAQAVGLDLEQIRTVLLANPQATTELEEWQTFRQGSMTRYYQMIHQGIHAIRPQIDLRFNECFRPHENWGLNLRALKPFWDSIRANDYTEQKGDMKLMSQKREFLTAERELMGNDFPMFASIATRPLATPEIIREGVRISLECKMNGVTLGHYDGATFPILKALGEALDESGVKVPKMLAKARGL